MPQNRRITPDSFPSNSRRPVSKRRVEKSNEPIAQGRKRGHSRAAGLANEVRTIGNNLFSSVVWPAIKNIVFDFFTQALDQMIFSGSGRDSGRSRGRSRYTQYHRQYSSTPSRSTRGGRSERSYRPSVEPFEDVYFGDRNEAEAVLSQMILYVMDYGRASVMDLYSLSGETYERIDDTRGWTNLDGVGIMSVHGDYVIDFPDPVQFR